MSEIIRGHLFECGCTECTKNIILNEVPVDRRIVTLSEYGSTRRVTVPAKARKRARWLEAEN